MRAVVWRRGREEVWSVVVQTVVRMWMTVLVVVALVACGAGGPGDGASAPPSAPTNVTATPGPGYVDVAWEHDGANVTGFVVERRVVSVAEALFAQRMVDGPPRLMAPSRAASDPVEVGSVGAAARSFRDEAVEAGVTYRYGVRAVGSGGATSVAQESSEQGVTPAPPGGNPDPSRYLTATIRDGDAPVASAYVAAYLIDHAEAFWPWRMYAQSDEDGVALLDDIEAYAWIPSGTYDVLVAAYASSSNTFVYALYEDVAVPGVVDVDLRDPRLIEVDVTLDVDARGETLLEFGRQVRGWTLFSEAIYLWSASTTVLLEPERYDTFAWFDLWGDHPTMVVGEVDLTTDRTFQLEFGEADLVSVTADATLPETVSDARVSVCLQDARVRHRHLGSYCVDAEHLRASPIVVDAEAAVRVDEDGAERTLFWRLGQRDLGPIGGEVVLPFGGVITAEIATREQTYVPGASVIVTGSVNDASGNPLQFMYTISRDPWRFETVRPTLLVVDAAGVTVFEGVVRTVSEWLGPEFTLPADAGPGEYTVTYRWDTGAYQGVVEATTTFDVSE